MFSKKWVFRICSLAWLCIYTLLMFMQKPDSGRKFWDGYEVLAVPVSVAEAAVLQILAEHGAADVISESTQPPLPVSRLAPVQYVADGESADAVLPGAYHLWRNRYFQDKSGFCQLFYIPEKNSAVMSSVQHELESEFAIRTLSTCEPSAGSFTAVQLVQLAVCLCIWAVLVLFCRHKLFFFIISVWLFLFAVCVPSLCSAAAVCILLYVFFLLLRDWDAQHSARACMSNPVTVTLFIVSAAVCAFENPVLLLFFVSAAAACAAAGMTAFSIHQEYRRSYVFEPVAIRQPARHSGITVGMIVGLCAVAAGLTVLCLCAFGAQRHGQPQEQLLTVPSVDAQSALLIPAPDTSFRAKNGLTLDAYAAALHEMAERTELPSLLDYVAWVWNTAVFPFRKLGGEYELWPHPDDTVSIPAFERVGNTAVETLRTMYVFDERFLASVIEPLTEKTAISIERLLAMQEQFVYTVYAPLDTAVAEINSDHAAFVVFAALISASTVLCMFIIGKYNDRYF